MPLKQLMTNGGLTANDFVMQLLADVLNKPVSKSTMSDVSALGAAYMAGLSMSIFKDIESHRSLKSDKIKRNPSSATIEAASWY